MKIPSARSGARAYFEAQKHRFSGGGRDREIFNIYAHHFIVKRLDFGAACYWHRTVLLPFT